MNKPRKKRNNFHKQPIDKDRKQRNEDSRKLGEKFFGFPNDPVRVKISDAVRFFDTLIKEEISYEDFEKQDLENLMQDFPFTKHMIEGNIIEPPDPPDECTPEKLDRYLQCSREYRLLFPTLDRATKKDSVDPCRDSTYKKFDLGIDTEGSLHVGAGRIIGSSVPLARRRIDWMQRSEIFEQREITEKMVVSDAAIPSHDGLGCGQYNGLVAWLARMARTTFVDTDAQGESYHRSMPIIAKLNIMDLKKMNQEGIAYQILYKPRIHNMEVIVGINIPSVTLNEEQMLADIRESNIWRNQCCYDADIMYDESAVTIDEALLCDNKNYDLLLEDLDLDITSPVGAFGDAKTVIQDYNPDKLETFIEKGYFEYTSVINRNSLKCAYAAMEKFDKQLERKFENYIPDEKFYELIDYDVDERHFRMRGSMRMNGKYMAKCYPIVMWLDILPKLGIRGLASMVLVIDLLREGVLKLSDKNKKLVWEDLRRQCGIKCKKK